MGKCGAEEIVPSAAAGLRDLSSVSAAFPSRLSLPSFHEAGKSFAPNAPRICLNSGGIPSRHTMSSSPPLTGRQFLLRITHPSARRKEAAASSPYIPSHAVSRLPLLRDGQFHL